MTGYWAIGATGTAERHSTSQIRHSSWTVETQGGSLLGLAERLTSSLQTSWPFVVALALRRASA
jgi:hypothetical protein